jgi:hypothetical protein
LLAGTIVDVDDQGDLTLKAVVRPSADLARVELVAVLVGREGLAPATLGDEGIDLAPAPRIKRRARPKDDETAGTPTMPDGPSVPTADQPGAAEAADAGVPEPADASPAVTLSSDATPAPVMPPPPAPASPPPRAPPPAPVAPPPQDAGVTP